MKTNVLIAAALVCAAMTACQEKENVTNLPENIPFVERVLTVTPGYALPAEAEAVDLGLSVKWANMNIGQTATYAGDRFAWGEISPKKSFSWDNYEFACDVAPIMLNHYVFGDNQKYNDGTKPGDILHKNDDAAYVMWGEDWRMPTAEEFNELLTLDFEVNYVTQVMRVKGKNGNYIDFPASISTNFRYWTSSIHGESETHYSTTESQYPLSTIAHVFDTFIQDYNKNKKYPNEFLPMNKVTALNVPFTLNGKTFDSDSYRYAGNYIRPVKK